MEGYKSCRNKKLAPLYIAAGIPANEPANKAKYLAEKIKLTQSDHEVLMKITAQDGKVAGLRFLEDLALSAF